MAVKTLEKDRAAKLEELAAARALIGLKDPRNDFSKWRLR